MQSTRARFSGGGHYPYPKEVWSPAGSFLFAASSAIGSGGHDEEDTIVWLGATANLLSYCVANEPGGWWSRPANWKSNTAVVSVGVVAAMYIVWTYSADKEIRHTAPTRAIPSMHWAKQFTSGEMGIKDESKLKGPEPTHH